jgi:hypothetical protein
MSETGQMTRMQKVASGLLGGAGKVWFLAALIGQGAFIGFIILYYGVRTVTGNFAGWNDKPIITGYVEGDTVGNLMFIAHVMLAAVVTIGGLLQLIPSLRRRFPTFHRWNGRIFIIIAFFMAFGGIWMGWVRGSQLSVISAIAITINGLLILVFATIAWWHAAARRIEIHKRWAMRTFMVVNGVWFLRIGIMAWILINRGPVGINGKLSGPADIVLIFGCYLIPLALLELYSAAQRSQNAGFKIFTALLVLLAAGITAIGIFGTVALMWGPYI